MESSTTTREAAKTGGAGDDAGEPDPVTARITALRMLANTDVVAAQMETWDWFRDAGRRIQSDRETAIGELEALFGAGIPSEGIDGEAEGILVGFTMQPVPDRALALLTGAWMPWAGKRFDAATQTGDNLLARSARWPAKLLWPLYGARDAGANLSVFDFTTRVEEGAVDPGHEVLVIDYAPVESNPRLVIKSIRDELVEVVPGTHLGKMLWRTGPYESPKDHHLLAFFALKTPLG